MNQIELINIQKWPDLDKNELVAYYNEIKANKLIKLDWTNPGRIDPKLYFSVKNEKTNVDTIDETSKESTNPLDNVVSSSIIDMNKFDLFDDDDFNTDDKKVSNEIFNIRLIHSSTRSRSSDNKVASMDKILGDMKKRFENEHKQIVSEDDTMLLVNDNFTDDLNPDQSEQLQQELNNQEYEQFKEQQQQIPDEKMDSESTERQPTEPSRPEEKEEKQQQLTSEETIQQETEMITNQEINIHQPQMEQKEPEKVIDYIETSTPYQAAENMNDSEDKKDEKHLPIEQIDSIRSNNRDESSDDKTNELSDTTEEIETFTRKETNQYRVLSDSVQESNNEQEVSNQTELNESEQIETIQKTNNIVQQIEQEEMKEIDSTTYKSQSPSPVKTNQQELEIETINREEEFVINEAKTNLFTSSSDLIEEDPLISQDLSNASISNENSQTETNSHLKAENF